MKKTKTWRGFPQLRLIFCLLLAACETQESLTTKRMESVEEGLLNSIFLKGQKPEKMSLVSRMQFYKVSGVSIAVLDKYQMEWANAYGVKDIQSSSPVTKETLFQAGALSQAVSAAAALHFVDKGRVNLDSDLNAELQTWKVPKNSVTMQNKVTLRGILTHSAGFPTQTFSGYGQGETLPSLKQILKAEKPAKNLPVEADVNAGSEVRYSESGFAVLQQLLVDLEKKPFPTIIRETIFDPLGMRNSTFEILVPKESGEKTASGHLREGRSVDGKWQNYPEMAAKGLWTSPIELLTFAIEIVQTAMGKSTKILSPLTAQAMLTSQVGNRGFGFSIGGSGDDINFSHQGNTRGFTCSLIIYPAKGQGVVIMTNSDNGFLLSEEILRAVSSVYEWADFKPQEKALFKLPPYIYENYVGRYQVSPDYLLDVTYEDYYLIIQPTGQAKTKFFVESETIFFSIDPFIRIQFRRNSEGRVDRLILWQQDFEQEAKKIQ